MTDTTTEQATTVRRRIAVLTADALAPSMAGPAIRARHIAEALSAEHEVRLATTGPCSLADGRFSIAHVDAEGLVVDEAEGLVLIQGDEPQGELAHLHGHLVDICPSPAPAT